MTRRVAPQLLGLVRHVDDVDLGATRTQPRRGDASVGTVETGSDEDRDARSVTRAQHRLGLEADGGARGGDQGLGPDLGHGECVGVAHLGRGQ